MNIQHVIATSETPRDQYHRKNRKKYLDLNSLGTEFRQSKNFKSTQVSAHKQVTPGTMKKVHHAQS